MYAPRGRNGADDESGIARAAPELVTTQFLTQFPWAFFWYVIANS